MASVSNQYLDNQIWKKKGGNLNSLLGSAVQSRDIFSFVYFTAFVFLQFTRN